MLNRAQIKLGWIGTGVMGKSMASHLMKAGYTNMRVFNRTASKADDLVRQGAVFAKSPAEVAMEVDFLFLMLGYPHDVEKMVFEPEHGIMHHMNKGSSLIDHTTSSPGLAEKIALSLEDQGVASIDAPVSGGDIGAKNGALVTMVGGE